MKTSKLYIKTNKRYTQYLIQLCLTTILFIFISNTIQASEEQNSSLDCSKKIFDNEYETKFKNLREINIEFSTQICKELLSINQQDSNDNIKAVVTELTLVNKEEIKGYFSNNIVKNDLEGLFDNFEKTTLTDLNKTIKLGSLKARRPGGKVEVGFNTLPRSTVVKIPDYITCSRINGNSYDSCFEAFDDISMAFDSYREHYKQYVSETNSVLLYKINKNWDNFLENARAQTLLDVWATTSINSDHYKKDQLVSPAPTQYFLLHPGLVYEHVNSAPDGERDKVSISMEWVGVNWWNLDIPVGISWVSTYSDRREISSVGQGIMIHIDNKYSLGWIHRKEGDGLFFSLDILKLFSDKKEQLEKYKSFL